MKILFISQYYYPEVVPITSLAEELVNRGHNVKVITGLPNYGFNKILPNYHVGEEVINGVNVYRLKIKARKKGIGSLIKNYLSFYKSSKKFFKRFNEDFDLVYACEMSPLISLEFGLKYAKKKNIPSILHCFDLWPESPVSVGYIKKNSLAYKILYKWCKKIYNLSDKIIISSPSFKDYFVNHLNLKKEYVYIPQVSKEYSFKNIKPYVYKHKINLVYCGNIGQLQLVDKFVEALNYCRDLDICLNLIGSGSMVNNILSIVKKNKLEDNVNYFGVINPEEVEKFYPNCDAIIFGLKSSSSPVSNTIPHKLISSLKEGKVIISCIKNDALKILNEAKGSLISCSEDPIEIAKCYKILAEMNDDIKKNYGENNLKYYSEHFKFSKVMDKFEKELVSIVK